MTTSSRETRASAASELLRGAISPRYTQEQIAERLKVTQQTISSWVQGRTKPSAAAMAALEDLLDIPMRKWAEPPPAPEEATAEPAPTFLDPPASTGTHGVG